MKNVKNGMGVTNMSDLILKEIYGICETKNLTKKQVKEYKMTEREFFEKIYKLSKDKLNNKSNKDVCVRNDVMTTVIKRCRGEKTKGIRAIDGFKNKLMIPDSEIPNLQNLKLNQKKEKFLRIIISL